MTLDEILAAEFNPLPSALLVGNAVCWNVMGCVTHDAFIFARWAGAAGAEVGAGGHPPPPPHHPRALAPRSSAMGLLVAIFNTVILFGQARQRVRGRAPAAAPAPLPACPHLFRRRPRRRAADARPLVDAATRLHLCPGAPGRAELPRALFASRHQADVGHRRQHGWGRGAAPRPGQAQGCGGAPDALPDARSRLSARRRPAAPQGASCTTPPRCPPRCAWCDSATRPASTSATQ